MLSDEHLVKHGESWPGVPLILVDGLLAFEASAWILDMRIRGFSKHTLISYAKSMALWLRALSANGIAWDTTQRSTAERFMATLQREGSSTNTVRLRMVHVQEFYRWAHNCGYLPSIPFHIKPERSGRAKQQPAKSPSVALPPSTNRRVKPQSQSDFDKVLEHSERLTPAVVLRDELIAEAARYMGLRRSEIAALRVDQFETLDLNQDVQVIEIISAKSREPGQVLVPRLYAKKMQDYIEVHRTELVNRFKKRDPAYTAPAEIFLNERGKRQGLGIDPNHIGASWRKAAVAAGLNSRFHDNRSSFATNAARAARNLGTPAGPVVKELLRHKQESTGEIYVQYDQIESDLLQRARIVNDGYAAESKSE